MRDADKQYFETLESHLEQAFARARQAKGQGYDPKPEVEIPVARDMADRVENILAIPDVAERIRELDDERSREEVALELVTDFVEGTVGDYDTREGKIEGAVRTAVALLTEGVVAAPIEGIDRVEILSNDDGSEFVNVYYAGPIRSAGGTAQALSVLVADYARSLLDIDEYSARTDETERYAEEVSLYDRETGLQYSPKDKETKFITKHMPIMLDGEATGNEEVSGYRDLERVDTNAARGGMCLVLAEGIALKAPKIQRYTRQLAEVEWPWLQDLIDDTIGSDEHSNNSVKNGEADIVKTNKDTNESETEDGIDSDDHNDSGLEPANSPRADATNKYLRDLIAGRPVFGHPSAAGAFRLRYGRARNHGFATAGVHPATMHIVDDFIATGTQLKTERPGKAGGVVPVDSIKGPTVRLANGDVRCINDPEEAEKLQNGVEKILDLGEYLVNFGEFIENNHPLAPAAYVFEWWIQEFEASNADVQALRDDPTVDLESPTFENAMRWAKKHDIPLHPAYTYLWHDISVTEFDHLADAVAAGEITTNEVSDTNSASGNTSLRANTNTDDTLTIDTTPAIRETMERLLIEHHQDSDSIHIPAWRALALSLGIKIESDNDTGIGDRMWSLTDLSKHARKQDDGKSAIAAVNEVAPFQVRERAPTRIGSRMGRPEKSEDRDLSPAVHTLFPIGEAGGNQRNLSDAAQSFGDNTERGQISVQLGKRRCPYCETVGFELQCAECGRHTEPQFVCRECESVLSPDESGRVHCDRCERDVTSAEWQDIDLHQRYRDALDRVDERESSFEILKGVKGLTSSNKTPEPLEKGILRAKHGVSSFKDGTVRYDMTDLPVTAVRPKELDVTAAHFRELGYQTDINGNPLQFDDQLVELKVQDIVLPDGAAEHMMKTADFVDDLLEQFYELNQFYQIDERDDLIGELVFGMAPHTSAAVVGRIVGFTSAAVGYAHPYFHAAKRRNCFHPETKIWFRDTDNEWHHETIQTFVEDRLDDPEIDAVGTLVQEVDDNTDREISVPSIDDNGNERLQSVTAVSKHRAPNHLVQIETISGREITITPDHEMHIFEQGNLVSKQASKITSGEYAVIPKRLQTISPSSHTPQHDLLREFLTRDELTADRLIIHTSDPVRLCNRVFPEEVTSCKDAVEIMQNTACHLDKNKETLIGWLGEGTIPVALLRGFVETDEALLMSIPDDVQIGLRGEKVRIDRHIGFTEELTSLLGYYAAAGIVHTQTNPISYESAQQEQSRITFYNIDTQTQTDLLNALNSVFEIEPIQYNSDGEILGVPGELIRRVFDTVFDVGTQPSHKRIPQALFDASESHITSYLRCFFSTHDSLTTDTRDISATTVSREFKEDIIAALRRLGITAEVTTQQSRSVPEVLPDWYAIDDTTHHDADNSLNLTRSYVISIASSDAVTLQRDRQAQEQTKYDAQGLIANNNAIHQSRQVTDGGRKDYITEPITDIEYVDADIDYTYCLTVSETHSLIVNDLSQKQCDGDEDCVMLLMDGLLNFSREYLPDKRGGSVAADSRLVAVSPDDKIVFTTIEDFWKKLNTPIERNGKFRKRTCVSEGWQTYAFDENHEASLRPIEKAIRYTADESEQLRRITTQLGRSLDITDEHSLFRYDDGIEEVAGDDLTAGDIIVAPRTLDVEVTQTTLDLSEYIHDNERCPSEQTGSGELNLASKSAISDSRNKETPGVTHNVLPQRSKFTDEMTTLSPTAVGGLESEQNETLRVGESTGAIERYINVDDSFGWLLGQFIAQRSISTDALTMTVHTAAEKHAERIVATSDSVFGIKPTVNSIERGYEVVFPPVFDTIVSRLTDKNQSEPEQDINHTHTDEIGIPECILHAPDDIVLSFLQGFILAENAQRKGNAASEASEIVSESETTVTLNTTSVGVKDGLVFLCHRLGIIAHISEKSGEEYSAHFEESRYTVSIATEGKTNPLDQILNGERPTMPEGVSVPVPDALLTIHESIANSPHIDQVIPDTVVQQETVSLETLQSLLTELSTVDLPAQLEAKRDELTLLTEGDLSYLRVESVECVDYDGYLYDLQVGGEPVFTANWLYAHNSMDAPLVMSSRIDPSEIDDEAHNMDIVRQYPREFYEATRRMEDPDEWEEEVTIAEEYLDTDNEYTGFNHTHDTTDIAAGPDLSAYKTLDSMMDKMDAQLELARKLRAVDETDVAERVIEYHFLPDLIGNLRAFSRQQTRCLDCGESYRRMPLTGECRECGGRVNLTVHEGSVNKYMDTAIHIAEEFDCREYTKQRLEVLERSLESIFEDDTNKQSGIADFM